MNRTAIVMIVLLLISSFTLVSKEKVPQKVLELAKELAEYGKAPEIIKAVKAQNKEKLTLVEIKKRDEKWKKTPGLDKFMKSLMESECGVFLEEMHEGMGYFAEIFVMDNQGANVALCEKTSDYWQGDEDKFIESFNKGKGAVHIGDIEFDDSSQVYLVQISVPVIDGKKVIGAITFGIDLDAIEKKAK